MILQLTRPIVFMDLETTGLDIETDRIVEIGLIRLMPDGGRQSLVERVDPGVDIPETATKIHGIHNAEVRGLFGCPRLPKIADQLVEFIGASDLGGFNSKAFDNPLWAEECRRHGIEFDFGARGVVDVKLIFNAKETGWDRFLMGPRNLSAATRHYCGRVLAGAHSAAVDAGATIDVLLAQLERYPELPRDVPGLHDLCETIQQDQQRQRQAERAG